MDSDPKSTHLKGHQTKAKPPYYPPHEDAKLSAGRTDQGHLETPAKAQPRPFSTLPSAPPPVVVVQAPKETLSKNSPDFPSLMGSVILVAVLVAMAIGFSTRSYLKWVTKPEYRWKILLCGAAAVLLLGLSYLAPIWPICLAAEISAAALGVTAGWCRINYERMRVTHLGEIGKTRAAELDDLGFFNARVAMKSADLFRISIADIPMDPEQRAAALELVDNYWQGKETSSSK